MKYLLDTNACIDIIRRPKSQSATRFKSTPMQEVGISIVSIGELWVGPYRKLSHPNEDIKVKNFLALVNIVAFDDSCAIEFGKVAAELLDTGTPIVDGLDVQIAATARFHGLVVVTRNLRDFG